MHTNKKQSSQKQNVKKALTLTLLGLVFVSVPVFASVLVQNFTSWNSTVEDPAIKKVAGADASTTGFLKVDLGQTISNNDSGLFTPGSSDTLLSNEQITFACFTGDRTYYSDVLQLVNTSSEDWSVDLTIEPDLNGGAAVSDTFADANSDGGDADIWLFASNKNSSTPIFSLPNPSQYGSLAGWYNNGLTDGGRNAIQLEITSSNLSAVAGADRISNIVIPAGEQRQLGLVVDCGANMADEIAAGTTGSFKITVAAKPS